MHRVGSYEKRIVMEKNQSDEMIEELWKIKEQFSSFYNKNIGQLV